MSVLLFFFFVCFNEEHMLIHKIQNVTRREEYSSQIGRSWFLSF